MGGLGLSLLEEGMEKKQDAIIRKHLYLLENGTISIEEVAEMCDTTIEHIEEVRRKLEEEKVSA